MLRKCVPESVAVVAPVSNQHVCGRQLRVDNRRALVVAHLTFGQKEDYRATGPVADSVQLGVQPTFRAPDTPGNIPPLFVDWRQSGGL